MIKIIKRISLGLLMVGTMALYPADKRVVIQNDTDAVMAMGAQMSHMRHMLEIYSLIGTGVSYKDPEKRLKVMIWDYEETIRELKRKYKNDKFVKNSVSKATKAWKPLKVEMEKALSKKESEKDMRKGAIFVHDNIRNVIKEMEEMKQHFVDISGAHHLKTLNSAIEIAASARRLSAHYMMKMWNLPDPTIEEHWNKGVEIFKKSLDTLYKSKFAKDAEFKKQLDIAKRSYKFLVTVSKFKGKYMPVAVQDKADKAYNAGMKMVEYILNHE